MRECYLNEIKNFALKVFCFSPFEDPFLPTSQSGGSQSRCFIFLISNIIYCRTKLHDLLLHDYETCMTNIEK